MRSRAMVSSYAAVLLAAARIASATTLDVGTGGAADCTFWCVDRYQQVYASTIFSGSVLIDSISFFAAPDNGGPNWNGVSTWQMTISTSVNPVGALDPAFANNVGGDVALFDTKTFTGTQNVNDLITFDGAGSFYYDPGNGDLLIDITRTAGTASGVGLDRGYDPGVLDRAYAFTSTTTADGWNQAFGNRTRFGLLEVPEPNPALLTALGLVVLGRRRRARPGGRTPGSPTPRLC
jgi:hypothetical protein